MKLPREAALPTLVIAPVRLAFVVTCPAVSPAAVPVKLVATPDTGVPSIGDTKVGLVIKGLVNVLLVIVSVDVLLISVDAASSTGIVITLSAEYAAPLLVWRVICFPVVGSLNTRVTNSSKEPNCFINYIL